MSKVTMTANSLEELRDVKNILEILRRLETVETRLADSESKIEYLLQGNKISKKDLKPKKDPIQVWSYEPYILEAISDGRIHSVYSMYEYICQKYPTLPKCSIPGLSGSLSRLAKQDKVERVAHGNYRKK